MEKRILLRAGIKKHKGSLVGIWILLFLTTLSLCTVIFVSMNGNRYVQEEIRRIGFGTLTAWVSDVPDTEELAENIGQQEGVESVSIQELVFSDYEANGTESDSEGQLLVWNPEKNSYRFLKNDFSGYADAPNEIDENEIYVSPSMRNILNLQVGDTISFRIARSGKIASFIVAGYFEDPVMGSSIIGMKSFLISQKTYDAMIQIIQTEGSDALARTGAMLHITEDRSASLTVSDLNQRLNENTSLSEYTEYVHSADTMASFMLILQNAFCGFLAAFSIVLLFTVLIVLAHSISGIIEQDWKNIGILKTIGIGGRELIQIQTIQYMLSIVLGLLAGVFGSVPIEKVVSQSIVTTSGVLVPAGIPILPSIVIFILLTALILLFIVWKLRGIHEISPIDTIQMKGKKEGELKQKKYRKQFQISGKSVHLQLAIRQVLSGKKHYLAACLVAVLLVFVTSMAGRMYDWLGADGQGMMDAFNPANLDMGIQVLGDLSQDEMEQIVRSYTEITDSYELAMQNVSVNGTNYTANVITEPERFHISSGKTSSEADEVVLTEMAADDLGVEIGDTVTIRGDAGTQKYRVSGIYHCANDMGANIGMSREGYLKIGNDDPRIWCHHYFLADSAQKQAITRELESTYGGDVHIHENTWPGLSGIIYAMQMLLLTLYILSVVFVAIVTVMTGSKILEFERRDMGIYKSIGFSSQKLRIIFSIRYGVVAVIGAVIGIMLANQLTDPLVSLIMRMEGISNFASNPDLLTIVMPGILVVCMFVFFAYLASGKIKRTDMSILTVE